MKKIASDSDSPTPSGDSLAGRLLRRLPGGGFAQEQLDRIERRVLRELKQRMDRVEEPRSLSVLAVSIETSRPKAGALAPGALLRELLASSAEQDREQAETALFIAVLRSLVPDEARILSALSDGSIYPLIHLGAGTRIGTAMRPVLEFASSVGKSAGVQCVDLTHVYVQRLRTWGLVDIEPEDYALITKYEMLETDDTIRKALDRIKKSGQKAHLARRTLKMSDLGNRLWAACRVSED